MAVFHSYDLQGTKDSFSDWISNISPEDTYIVSTSKKVATPSTSFRWQSDKLAKIPSTLADVVAILDGSDAPDEDLIASEEKFGYIQTFRKTFSIADTALAVSSHGRSNELKYQLEKAGKELKNIMEVVFCSRQTKQIATGALPWKTDGLFAQIAAKDATNPQITSPGVVAADTVVHIENATAGTITEDEFFKVTKALFLNGSKADCIVTNPINAPLITKLRKAISADADGDTRQLYWADTTGNEQKEFDTITDQLGKIWKVCYCRFCDPSLVYFLGDEYIVQRVLSEPKATKLAKYGSNEKWMLTIEAGISVGNPWSCGVIELKP